MQDHVTGIVVEVKLRHECAWGSGGIPNLGTRWRSSLYGHPVEKGPQVAKVMVTRAGLRATAVGVWFWRIGEMVDSER